MRWINFLRVIATVTVIELKTLLRNTSKNDIFDFAASALAPILNTTENWQETWVIMFKKLLARIKTGKGYEKDKAFENGMYVSLPFPETNMTAMVIFFIPSQMSKTGRFLIYDFKIVTGKHVTPFRI